MLIKIHVTERCIKDLISYGFISLLGAFTPYILYNTVIKENSRYHLRKDYRAHASAWSHFSKLSKKKVLEYHTKYM